MKIETVRNFSALLQEAEAVLKKAGCYVGGNSFVFKHKPSQYPPLPSKVTITVWLDEERLSEYAAQSLEQQRGTA